MGGSVIGAMIATVVLTAVAFAHAIGPSLMLVAITPFDAIPFTLFGTAGNLITYVPILIFLIRMSPRDWGRVFLGTRVQQWAVLFVIALLVSHVMPVVDRGLEEIWEWLRKVTLLLLLGIFAWSMRDARHVATLAKVAVSSMALFVSLAALDFYLGVQVLPIKAGMMETAALDTEFESHLASGWRFTGPGFPVNRFSNYLLLTIFLGVGWVMHAKLTVERAIALACTGILVSGELLTATRSGILGMAVGGVLLLPLAFRFRAAHVAGLVLVGGTVGVLVFHVLGLTSGTELLAQRFEFDHVIASTGGRLERIVAAFKIWAEHPFLGVGWGTFSDHSWRYISAGGLGAHNGYTNVLAECGLLGFIPMMILTVAVIRRLLVNLGSVSKGHEFWRVYFLCGLVAQLTTNVFNDYFWERYLWLSFAFVVAVEHLVQAARLAEARKRSGRRRRSSQPRHVFAAARSAGGA